MWSLHGRRALAYWDVRLSSCSSTFYPVFYPHVLSCRFNTGTPHQLFGRFNRIQCSNFRMLHWTTFIASDPPVIGLQCSSALRMLWEVLNLRSSQFGQIYRSNLLFCLSMCSKVHEPPTFRFGLEHPLGFQDLDFKTWIPSRTNPRALSISNIRTSDSEVAASKAFSMQGLSENFLEVLTPAKWQSERYGCKLKCTR